MLDTSFVRENFDAVRSRLSTRNFDPAVLDGFIALDLERRSLVRERDDLNAATNRISKEVGSLMREGRRDEAELHKVESKKIAERARLVETRLAEIESGFRETLEVVPNLPHESVPIGKDESANTEVRRVGKPRDFTRKASSRGITSISARLSGFWTSSVQQKLPVRDLPCSGASVRGSNALSSASCSTFTRGNTVIERCFRHSL